jgi:hypothetical protein
MSKEAMKLALEALEPLVRRAAPWGEQDWLNGCKAIIALREALAEQPAQQEPVAWVYPEGLDALKAGKPWTAYGTRQEPNNTALYLSPQPDIPPYAWVTFTPYGDEDDVWYENPEGQLLEGWTYKPLYDTTPPAQRKPLTDEQILRLVPGLQDCLCDPYDYNNSGDDYASVPKDMIRLARAIEAAHGITGETK